MTKEEVIVDLAQNAAALSKCKDKKTAAILVSQDLTQIYSVGINGGPRGGTQCLCGVKGDEADRKLIKYTCAHSEMNCLVKNKTIDDTPKILICTKQPCQMCATLIINANTNIKEVWFIDKYWDSTGIELLGEAGIIVKEIVFTKSEGMEETF